MKGAGERLWAWGSIWAVQSREAIGSLKSQDKSRIGLLGCALFSRDVRPPWDKHAEVCFMQGQTSVESGVKWLKREWSEW